MPYPVLPKAVSDLFPRRGRTTADVKIGAGTHRITLEPDGRLGHWLRIGEDIYTAMGASIGDEISLQIAPVAREPEPEVPGAVVETGREATGRWTKEEHDAF